MDRTVRRRALRLAFIALAGAQALALAAAPPVLDKIALQLKWRHQFQFAGYYAAAEKGYYREAGLEVEIREASPTTLFTDEVVEGRAQYGINNTDLLIDRIRGKPVVVLGVVFQHSPLVLLSLERSGLSSPKDFIGKKVMVSLDSEAEIFSMFSNESVPKSSIDFIQHSWNIEDLISGKTDAASAYLTNEVLDLEARGIRYSLTRPLTYGIDFYGDCLFTSEAELRRHPARAAAFLAATIRGWDYALDNVEETCDLILAKYSREKSKAALLAEAAAMDGLVVHKFVPIGFMNPGRWRHIGDTYAKLAAIPADYSLDGFLYDPKAPGIDPRALKLAVALLAAAMAAAMAYILILRAFNSRLASEVAARTAGLNELNLALSVEILERKEKERLIAVSLAEKEVLLKEVHHRVKNNLQVVASILNMQLEGEADERAADTLAAARNRIFSMALVHERLYASDDLSLIGMEDYLRALVAEIVQTYQRPGLSVAASVEAPGIAFALERAIPLGLIVGELVANSMKHAFAGRGAGGIHVSLRSEGGRFELRADDDGGGLSPRPSGGRAEAGGGLGLKLVEALASQLGGELRREEAGGLAYSLSFA